MVSNALCNDGTDVDGNDADAGALVEAAGKDAAAVVVVGLLLVVFAVLATVVPAAVVEDNVAALVSVVADGLPIQCKTLPFSNLYSVITFVVVSAALSVINRPR